MRGDDRQQGGMFSYVSLEDRVPAKHPLRKIRSLVQPILKEMSPRFDATYSRIGRPSIPPEMLLRALLLQPPVATPYSSTRGRVKIPHR